MEVIREKGGSATPKETREGIALKMDLADDFLAMRHEKSNLLKFQNQVYWARTYLGWEKLVETSTHGVWSLTETGRNASVDYPTAVQLVRKWVKFHQANKKSKQSDAEALINLSDNLTDDIEDKNEVPLLDIIKKTTPAGFEHLCGRLLREYNFEDVKITQRSGDGGIDGTATLKLNPFVNMSVFLQCKRYEGSVPISHIREFIGVLASEQNGADRGLFITTGTLPKSAYELERKNTKLELIDGDKLVEMFEKIGLGVTPRTVYDPDMAFFAQFMEK